MYIRFLFNDFWSLREALSQSNGIAGKILLTAYHSYMKKEKFFIGSNAAIQSIPVFPHGMVGIYISEGARIGSGCTIFPYVAIGSNTIHESKGKGSPSIGDNCFIGIGATIIGGISIGNNCRIGANCTVTENIPDNCVVVPQKPRILRKDRLVNTWNPY